MGWKTGQGLGLNSDGTTSHIKISVKDDTLGVGASLKDAEAGWLNNSKSYQEVLDRLSKSCESKDKKDKKKESKKDSHSDKKKKKLSDKKESKKSDKTESEKKKKVKKPKSKSKEKEKEFEHKPPTLLKSAHRAKFIRNKSVSSYSAANLKEILGGINI